MAKIVVIGGTGLIGSKVVAKLTENGHEAIAASPNTGVDSLTGEGLAEALTGADTVIDVSNSPSFAPEDVLEFFTTSTRNLIDAEAAAGVTHHVALTIVGTNRPQDIPYFTAKVAQEKLIRDSGIPYSLVHATQFFEFVGSIADISTEGDTVTCRGRSSSPSPPRMSPPPWRARPSAILPATSRSPGPKRSGWMSSPAVHSRSEATPARSSATTVLLTTAHRSRSAP